MNEGKILGASAVQGNADSAWTGKHFADSERASRNQAWNGRRFTIWCGLGQEAEGAQGKIRKKFTDLGGRVDLFEVAGLGKVLVFVF